ncbi:hypothetical protein [Cohnella sp. GCM10012308]|uniref:hypothetical protein n=1 Tax=Cohnella sp. GCM10012308 TaxID=3317329 RepID=UPI003613A152
MFAAFNEIHANMQVNLKAQPEIGLMEENNCAIASFLLERIEIGENGCIFAGIAANERRGDDKAGLSERLRDEISNC